VAERRRTRRVWTASIGRHRGRRYPGRQPDASDALTALARAWTTTVVASLIFVAALAVSEVWDGAVFDRALRDTLSRDAQLPQPSDDLAAADPSDGNNR
jgi:hypothetical protein